MVLDDVRKTFEALIGQLTPAKAQELAKRYLEPEAAKEQVSKTAGELVQLSQRLREAVRREVASQMRAMGAATQDDLDALRKRVRDLERTAGKTASGRKTAGQRTTARKSTAQRSTARKVAARTRSTARRAEGTTPSGSGARKPTATA